MIKSVYYDYGRKKNGGAWVTIHKTDTRVNIDEHPNERAAREFIGLEGGSTDPSYHPLRGKTGAQTVEVAE